MVTTGESASLNLGLERLSLERVARARRAGVWLFQFQS